MKIQIEVILQAVIKSLKNNGRVQGGNAILLGKVKPHLKGGTIFPKLN